MPKVHEDLYPKVKGNGQITDGYYLDGYLKSNLEHIYTQVTKKDYDGFIIITGREGFGKSTLAMQIAKFLDKDFGIDNVVFTAQQFQEATENAKKHKCIVFDETMGYLGSRGATSKFNRMLVKIMSEMRSKNLFIILCIPNFFELDKYPAIHRSTGLIHVHKRGRFGSYDYRKKKQLYLSGKRFYEYNISPSFTGQFVKFFPLDKVEYENKKQSAINTYRKENIRENVWKDQRDKLILKILDNNVLTKKEISDEIGLSLQYVSQIGRGSENGGSDEK